jgi:hypothetical protein
MDTNKLLRNIVSPSGGLYYMHSVFHHCWECSGFGCLQNLANATNTPVNSVLNYIATVLGDAATGVFKTLVRHSKSDAMQKGPTLIALLVPTKDEGM